MNLTTSAPVGANVEARQGASASPGYEFDGNNDGNASKGEAGESFASPIQEKIYRVKCYD
jgi:hypothetical protein